MKHPRHLGRATDDPIAPARGRGLKLKAEEWSIGERLDRPREGARIETWIAAAARAAAR